MALHRILLCLVAIGLLLQTSIAQISVKGRILGKEDKQAVVAAIISLSPVGRGTMRQTTSDKEGNFAISISDCDSAWLRVRSLGSVPYATKISTRESSRHTIFLTPADIKLKEVIVDAPIIQQKGDTLTYASNLFKTADDKVLADVLRRLPGLEVADNGRITYQGKPISRFYVEGLDLMQGRYGIVTNNLDVNKVASVQVLERHQPVRMLQGVEMPSTAAINIRLQRSHLGAFFATLKLGATLPIGGYSNQLSLMRFARTQQNLLVVKQDNTGRRLDDELESHYGASKYESLRVLSSALSLPPLNNPALRFNKDWYTALSNLVRIDSLATLSLNILHKNTREDREEGLIRQIYQSGATKREVRELNQGRERKSDWDVNLDYEANRPTSYLKNKLQFISQHESLIGESRQGADLLPVALSGPRLTLSNSLSWMKPISRGRYELSWRAGFTRGRQELSLAGLDDLVLTRLGEPMAAHQVSARQYALHQKLGTELGFTRSLDYNKLSLQYFAKAEGEVHKLDTELSLQDLGAMMRLPSNGSNELHQYEARLGTGIGFKYKGITRLELGLKLPIFGEVVRVARKAYQRLNVLPSLSAKYEFNPRYTLSLDLNTRTSDQDILQEASGYILSSRHYLRQGSGRRLDSYTGESTLLLSIRYPRQGLFYTLWHRGEYEHRREIARLEYLGGLVATNHYAFSHNNLAHNVGGSADWHIKRLRLQTRLRATYSYRQTYADIEGEIQKQDVQSYTLGGSLNWVPSKHFSTNYSLEYAHSIYDFGQLHSKLDRLKQTFTASMSVGARLRLSSNLYHTSYRLSQNRYNVWLTGAKLSYKLSKSCEATIEGTNVLDKHSLSIHRQSEREIQIAQYPMRGAEYLFSIRLQL